MVTSAKQDNSEAKERGKKINAWVCACEKSVYSLSKGCNILQTSEKLPVLKKASRCLSCEFILKESDNRAPKQSSNALIYPPVNTLAVEEVVDNCEASKSKNGLLSTLGPYMFQDGFTQLNGYMWPAACWRIMMLCQNSDRQLIDCLQTLPPHVPPRIGSIDVFLATGHCQHSTF